MKKIGAFLLVLTLSLSVFSACGSCRGQQSITDTETELTVNLETDTLTKETSTVSESKTDTVTTESYTESETKAVSDTESETYGSKESQTESKESNPEITTQTESKTETDAVVCNHEWKLHQVLQNAACLVDGVCEYVCQCGETSIKIDEAKGHCFGDWMEEQKATCISRGEQIRKCLVCQEKETKYIPILEHQYTVTDKESGKQYFCSLCDDTFVIDETTANEIETASQDYIIDCDSNYSFEIICRENEEYIRSNLRVIDAYFEGSEYENSDTALCEYSLKKTGESVWRVTPIKDYTAGSTYKAKRTGGVIFRDSGFDDLTFSIYKEKTNQIELSDDVIFVQKLENKTPGYYPYSVNYSEGTGTSWVTLGKTDGLKIGDIICVGNATDLEGVLTDADNNIIGKITSISEMENGKKALINLSTPALSEIFKKIDLYSSSISEQDGIKVSESLNEEIIGALYDSDDFAHFLAASYDATVEYLEKRGLSSTVDSFAEFVNSIDLDTNESKMPYTVINENGNVVIAAKIVVYGKIEIPVTLSNDEDAQELGSLVITFKAYVELNSLELRMHLEMGKVTIEGYDNGFKFNVDAIQEITCGISFEVQTTVDYSAQSHPYVLNNETGVYHYKNCKHVAFIKDDKKISRITVYELFKKINDPKIEIKECGSCKPMSAMLSTIYVINTESSVFHTSICAVNDSISQEHLIFSEQTVSMLRLRGFSPCGTCTPEQTEHNNFSEDLLSKIQNRDFGENMDEVKSHFQEIGQSNKSKDIELITLSYSFFGVDKEEISFYIYVDFHLEANLKYENQVGSLMIYTFRTTLDDGPKSNFLHAEKCDKNKLTVIGKTRLDVGLKIGLGAGIRLAKNLDIVEVYLDAKAGLYAKLHGALSFDFNDHSNEYCGAYFEAGIHASIKGRIKSIIFNEKELTICSGDFPINGLRFGYEDIYYAYEAFPQMIEISLSRYDLSETSAFDVKCFDLIKMSESIEKLDLLGENGHYSVSLTLESGKYCKIENGSIVVTDSEIKEFTDYLTVTVVGYDNWKDFKDGNIQICLDTKTVEINFTRLESELEFALNDDKKSYSVIGIGKCKDTELIIPAEYKGLPVTIIGDEAFDSCDNLVSVIIPDSVISIGDMAFFSCDELVSVYIPDAVTAIGNQTFDCCDNLVSIRMSSNIFQIGYSAFKSCPTEAYYQYDNAYYLGNETNPYVVLVKSFNREIESCKINDKTRVILDYAFQACVQLKEMSIPIGVENICCRAFDYCIGLKEIIIPDSAVIIGDYAFSNCTALENVILGNHVINIGYGAFKGCTKIASIKIPDSVMYVGEAAFYDCTGLISVYVGEGIIRIGESAFGGCELLEGVYITNLSKWCAIQFGMYGNPLLNSGNLYLNGELITDLVVPYGVTGISDYAFDGGTCLISVKLPETVKKIGIGCFKECDNIERIVVPSSIKSIGEGAFLSCDAIGEIYISDIAKWCEIQFGNENANPIHSGGVLYLNEQIVSEIEIPGGITHISDYAFINCSNLERITIPNGVNEIGRYAFANCSSLMNVQMPDSITEIGSYAFYKSGLSEVVIPSGVTEIKDYTFYGCCFKSVSIPEGVWQIGNDAFGGCYNLEDVTVPNSITVIGSGAFEYCWDLVYNEFDGAYYLGNESNPYLMLVQAKSQSIESCAINAATRLIYSHAFEYCRNLESVVVPDGITFVGEGAFYKCNLLVYNEYGNAYYLGNDRNPYVILIKAKDTDISSCEINKATKIIYDHAFYNCSYLTDIIIPNGVHDIGTHAFAYCKSIVSLTIPDSVTNIGEYAFRGCIGLEGVVIPEGVADIAEGAFLSCTNLATVVIENGVKTIGRFAFCECTNLSDIDIPDSVKEIRYGAFSSCSNLQSVNIGNGVQIIDYYVFENCCNLTSVTLGFGIRKIMAYAFEDCIACDVIFYTGSQSEWSEIYFSSAASYPKQVLVIFNYQYE